MAKNIHVIVNPVSGPASVPVEEIESKLEVSNDSYTVVLTSPDIRTTDLARRAVDHGDDLVIAAGGDGTMLSVAEGLIGNGVPLGIIPEGTANVFATELGIPPDSGEALDLLLQRNTG